MAYALAVKNSFGQQRVFIKSPFIKKDIETIFSLTWFSHGNTSAYIPSPGGGLSHLRHGGAGGGDGHK